MAVPPNVLWLIETQITNFITPSWGSNRQKKKKQWELRDPVDSFHNGENDLGSAVVGIAWPHITCMIYKNLMQTTAFYVIFEMF